MPRTFHGTTSNAILSPPAGLTRLSPSSMAFTFIVSVRNTMSGVLNAAFVGMDTGSGSGRVMQFRQASAKANLILFTSGGAGSVSWAGAKSINDGVWHRVAVSYDGSKGVIVTDGTVDAGPTAQTAGDIVQGAMNVGAQLAGVSQAYYDGQMAELAFFSRALPLEAMKAITRGAPVLPWRPDHYWPLNGYSDVEPDLGFGPGPTDLLANIGATHIAPNGYSRDRGLVRSSILLPPIQRLLLAPPITTTPKSDSDTAALTSTESVLVAQLKSDSDTLFTADATKTLAAALTASDTPTVTAAVTSLGLSTSDSAAVTSSASASQSGTTPSDADTFALTSTESIAAAVSDADTETLSESGSAVSNTSAINDSDTGTLSDYGSNASGGVSVGPVNAIQGVVIGFGAHTYDTTIQWTRIDQPAGVR